MTHDKMHTIKIALLRLDRDLLEAKYAEQIWLIIFDFPLPFSTVYYSILLKLAI
jgi:hypothetical protein